MKTDFKDWKEFIEASGSKVEEVGNSFIVTGDVILINCGLTHIPSNLVEVTGTLDISLNPIKNFECNLKNVRRLICMGTKPISLKNIDLIKINSAERKKISASDVTILGYTIQDIEDSVFIPMTEKIPELKGLF